MIEKHSETGTQAVQRALAILECFTRGVEDLSLTDISRIVNIPYSTASRITGILEEESFLYRDRNTKRYRIGRKVYGLGYCARQSDFLRKIIHPYLVELRDEFRETALIYVREGNDRICLEKASAFNNFKFSPTVGSKFRLWAGAGSRGFLAYMEPEELEQTIAQMQQLTPFTKTDKKRLMADLFTICKYGCCFCSNEYQEGFSSIAGLVVDGNNSLLCTISVTGPTSDFTGDMLEGLSKRLPQYCLEISSTFGKNDDTGEFMFESPTLPYIIENM